MKVGDYIRTKDGIIDEVIIDYNGYCNNPNCNRKHVSCKHNYYDEDKIIKSSPKIIDLIEVGDYVNGIRVDGVDDRGIYNNNEYDGWPVNICSSNDDIKSVITKEQIEQISYKVGK